jgi:hypothetical protein
VRHVGARANGFRTISRGILPANEHAAQDRPLGETLPDENPALFPVALRGGVEILLGDTYNQDIDTVIS